MKRKKHILLQKFKSNKPTGDRFTLMVTPVRVIVVVQLKLIKNLSVNKPKKKARRWVVKVAHSWFNRFRKLLVRYEKLDHSFMALNHLAGAIIAFTKVPLKVNIIYG